MKAYHIKDSYFIDAEKYLGTRDTGLMKNKEGRNYRPHFLCFKDNTNNNNIYWAIPLSSKVNKYINIISRKISKMGRCDTIVIGKFAGKDSAFLIQNMFPITLSYVDHVHTVGGIEVQIHKSLEQEIVSKANRVLSQHRLGSKLLFTDVDALYDMLTK